MFEGAHRTLGQFLLPLTVDDFLDKTLIGGFQKIEGSGRVLRTGLLGVAPSELLLQAVHLAPKLTFHSANPSGAPPALESISDASVFRRSIDQLHAGKYSVRFPDLRPLSQPLDILARAIEVLLHQPVTASAFWSRSGMKSPVHHDDHDLIAVQIRGSKRWYIASGPSELNNTWSGIPRAASPELGNHTAVDMQPGDLLYVPRGTLHSVASESESLHVAIGFAPLTVRAAVLAALDHLSDLDQRLRMTIGGPHAAQLHGKGFDKIAASIADGAERLASACRIPGVNRRAKLTTFRRPTLTRVGRLFEGSAVSDFI